MIEAFGGVYQGFEELALNPLDCGPYSKTKEQQVLLMMKTMLGERSSSDEDEDLEFAARMAFSKILLSGLHQSFPRAFTVNSPLRAAFRKWVEDAKAGKGVYSHIFNAGHDSLASALSRSHSIGINMTKPSAIRSRSARCCPYKRRHKTRCRKRRGF